MLRWPIDVQVEAEHPMDTAIVPRTLEETVHIGAVPAEPEHGQDFSAGARCGGRVQTAAARSMG